MRETAVGLHQRIGSPCRDFDMIAEHAIVPDLERRHAGRGAKLGLQRGDRAASARAGIAQVVECGVISRRDIPPVRRFDRWRWYQRTLQQVDQAAMAAQQRCDVAEQARRIGKCIEPLPQVPGAVETVAQLAKIAR